MRQGADARRGARREPDPGQALRPQHDRARRRRRRRAARRRCAPACSPPTSCCAPQGGRFVSPLDTDGPHGEAVAGCENVNTWPVLAAPDDDVVLGAAMFLPDHPRIAPESLGNLFDNTEIEEALLLHVQTLSEEERREIAAQDPKVREMVERAERATPEQMLGLHGRLEPGHPQLGEPEATVGERTIRRGARVVLQPAQGRRRPLRHDPRRPRGDGRADLRRLRGRRPPRRHRRRRPRPGADARERPLPVLPRSTRSRAPRRRGRMAAPVERGAARSRSSSPGSATPSSPTTASAAPSPPGLGERELPAGVTVMDFGTGGLDLAYEVMRGYDALVIVDISRQGGEPGTLYVIEPEESEIEAGIEDGEMIDPHGMDPKTVLRFVNVGRRLAGQGRGRRLRAGAGRGDGAGAERRRRRGGRPRRRRPCWSRSTSCTPTRPTGAERVHELSLSQRDPRHRPAPRRGPAGEVGADADRGDAPGRPRVARASTSRSSPARPLAEGAALEVEYLPALLRCRECGARVGAGAADVPLPVMLGGGRSRR